jgi:hypothetical protein
MDPLPIPKQQATKVEHFLNTCLTADHKFVRAWAYHGYHHLATSHPKYRDETTALLQDALETETAASVLARVRKLLKKGFITI